MAQIERNMAGVGQGPENTTGGAIDRSSQQNVDQTATPGAIVAPGFEGRAPQTSTQETSKVIPKESPVPGLTAEEVELFIASGGETIEGLRELIAKFGPESFLQQARSRLEYLRSQQAGQNADLTPEQIAQKQAEQRAQRISKLREDLQNLQNMKADTSKERLLIQLRRARIERDLSNEEGSEEVVVGGGDGGRGGPPEIPRGPEPPEGLEEEASPERGRQIIREIIKWEALRAAGKYKEVDWRRLNELYVEHEIHIEACRMLSLRVSPREPEEFQLPPLDIPKVNPDNLKDVEGNEYPSLQALYEESRTRSITDREKFIAALDAYFAEARRVGILKDLDAVLSSVYREVRVGIGRKQTTAELMPRVEQEIQIALNSLEYIYEDRDLRGDPGISRLVVGRDSRTDRLIGVGDLYVQFVKQRLVAAINDRDLDGITQRGYLDHEFHLEEEGEETSEETYWRLEHGWYITIYAQTKEEFMVAADSFLSRLELITAAPEKIFQDATQFIDVLYKSEGAKKLLGNENTKRFIPDLILGMEARIGMFGADNSNERYDAESYKKFMDFINKDAKGPERWLELAKLLDGNIAAAVWALDKDPRWEILFSLHGSRGQLAETSYAQKDRDTGTNQGLYNQVLEQLVEEMLGVQIKNKANVGILTDFMTDREFVSMFDGLYRYGHVPEGHFQGDANVRAFEQFKDVPDIQLSQARRRQKRLGGIQLDLRLIDEGGNGKKLTDLSLSDQNFYKKELSKAEKAVGIALQIYGATGEKSKRGGGIFTVNKIGSDDNEYQDFVPIHYAEKFVQFAETWTKMKYSDDSEIWNDKATLDDYFARRIKEDNKKKSKDELFYFKAQYRTARCKAARKLNIAEFKKHGFEAKLYDVDYDKDGKEVVGSRRVIKIKRPKENPSATDDLELARDAKGKVIKGRVKDKNGNIIDELERDDKGEVVVEEVPVDFYTATHHPYGDWSGHTYWSYQEEHRHLLLSSKSFAQARQIRDGKLRWEDADPVSVQLLILDPTLKRVARFPGKQFVEREAKLTMAAVEDSYVSHWRISRELYKAFWPKSGTPTSEIGVYYGLQDFGGFRKTVEHMRARFAENPERFMRRGRRLLPYLHNPVAPLSEYLGQGSTGALGPIRMMGYPVYKLVGTFALDKFSANAEWGKRVYDALDGGADREGKYAEGLLLKPMNNSDKLQVFYQKIPPEWTNPAEQNAFCYALLESFDRLGKYERLLTDMESRVRNASGALWLEGVDIFIDNGQINPEVEKQFDSLPDINNREFTRMDLANFIKKTRVLEENKGVRLNDMFNETEIDESKSPNTGSGKHSAKFFHDIFMEVMLDESERGGAELYPNERYFVKRIKDEIIYATIGDDEKFKTWISKTHETISDFIFYKSVPT